MENIFNFDKLDPDKSTNDASILVVNFKTKIPPVPGGVHTFTIDPKGAFNSGLSVVKIRDIPKNVNFVDVQASEVNSVTRRLEVGSAKVLTLGVNYDSVEDYVQVYVFNSFSNPIHCALKMLIVT